MLNQMKIIHKEQLEDTAIKQQLERFEDSKKSVIDTTFVSNKRADKTKYELKSSMAKKQKKDMAMQLKKKHKRK
jgi:hypothetical protein